MCAANTLTQFFAHPFQVVQIVSHGVREVHKNVKVQGAFGWSKDLNIHLPLLSRQKAHAHQLRRNLGLQEFRVDGLILNRRNQKNISCSTSGLQAEEHFDWLEKTYSFYPHAASSCDYSLSTAPVGHYVFIQVTARTVESLHGQEV